MQDVFVHLRVHSDYTLGQGASKFEALVDKAISNRQPAMALTDDANLHAALALSDYAPGKGLQPIIGTKLLVQSSVSSSASLLLLAQNQTGYANICRLVNLALQRDRKMPNTIDSDLLLTMYRSIGTDDCMTDGIIAIAGSAPDGVFSPNKRNPITEDAALKLIGFLGRLFKSRFYVEICRNGPHTTESLDAENAALRVAAKTGLPIVATSDVWYATEDRHEAYEILNAVQSGDKSLLNATPSGVASKPQRFDLRSTPRMKELFKDLPEAFENTAVIARRCAFKVSERKPMLPPFKTEGGRSEVEELRAQAIEGLEARFVRHNIPEAERATYRDRLGYELSVIEKMGFPGYFLIVADFIKWAKDRDIPVGPGRGSGAGSVAAWALTITEINPLPLGLLFERFLNPERVSMPDFDIDFCQDRRGEVVHYVRDKYGADHVSLIATFHEIKAKNAIRDAGRVISTPDGPLGQWEINDICNVIPFIEGSKTETMKLLDGYKSNDTFRSLIDSTPGRRIIFDNATKIEGLFRNSGAHAAGVIIGGAPLTTLVPIGFDPKSDMSVAQFDMKDSEHAGLVKFDFLGSKTLSVIREALRHIKTMTGKEVDVYTLPFEDDDVYKLLATGDSNGVFQLESDGMKRVLRDIRPTRFEDLIAVISLFRPGPMGMIPLYAARKNGHAEIEYLEPVERTKPFLEETYGIIVYQEQVMQVAQVVAGYSLGGADLLRRAMGKKIKSEMDAQREQFVSGAEKNGMSREKSEQLFATIAKFAEYGFNKSHAAAYSAVAFYTAWLKCHYPAAFFAALMTYEVDNVDKLGMLKSDMDRIGLKLLPPDINASNGRFSVEKDAAGNWAVRLGLSAVKSIAHGTDDLVRVRNERGPFKSLEDFHFRAGTIFASAQIQKLVECGAFDSISPSRVRKRTFDTLIALAKSDKNRKDTQTVDMLAGLGEAPSVLLPDKVTKTAEWSDYADREFNAVGFFFRGHPLLDRRLANLHDKGGVRRKEAIIQHMTANNLENSDGRKVLGLVSDLEHGSWPDGGPKLRFRLQERADSYWVTVSQERMQGAQTVQQMADILTSAVKNRLPVVLRCDFYRRKRDDSIGWYARQVWLADDYANECGLLPVVITLSTSALRLNQQDMEQFTPHSPTTFEAFRVFAAEKLGHSIRLLSEVTSRGATDLSTGRTVAIQPVYKLGNIVHPAAQISLPGRYLLDQSTWAELRSIPGVESVRDELTSTDEVTPADAPAIADTDLLGALTATA